MKQSIWMGLLVFLMIGLTACGDKETKQESSTQVTESSSQILIAYFSLADIVPDGADAVSQATPSVGNTESAALEIQKQTGGDLFAIRTEKSYPISHSECSEIAEEEMRADARLELIDHIENMDQYSRIYIGYPLWWYQEPMAIRTFLEEYDFSRKTLIPFCTSLGADVELSEENIQELCPDAEVFSGLTLHTGSDSFSEQISDWLRENMGSTGTNTAIDYDTEVSDVKVKITVGDMELLATLEDNATTRELISQMPMTLPMMDLYGREMCYRYGAYALPTDNLQSDGYEVGDIAYWAPGGSLVILYKQNGECFERQHLGHIDSGVEVFENMGDMDVTFEVVGAE